MSQAMAKTQDQIYRILDDRRFAQDLGTWIPGACQNGYSAALLIREAYQQVRKIYEDHARKNKKRAKAEALQIIPQSIVTALVTFAVAGLRPNSLTGMGYLIPYGAGKSQWSVLTPVFGYKGLKQLARAAGSPGYFVREIRSGVIGASEEAFIARLQAGELPREIVLASHIPAGIVTADDIAYAYSLYRAADGAGEFYASEIMTREQVLAIKGRSKASDGGPWGSDFARMAEKCPVRRQIAAGNVPVEYYAAVAVSVEGAAEGGNFSLMRSAMAEVERVGKGGYADDAAAEIADYIDIDPDAAPDVEAVAERDPAKTRPAREIHDEIGKCTSLARLGEIEREIDAVSVTEREMLFHKVVERREVLEERGA